MEDSSDGREAGRERKEVLYQQSRLGRWSGEVSANPLRQGNLRLQGLSAALIGAREAVPPAKVAASSGLLGLLEPAGELLVRHSAAFAQGGPKSRALLDPNPAWARLHWNAAASLLFLARSAPTVDVFEAGGAYCCSLALEGARDADFHGLRAVAGLASQPLDQPQSQFSDRLLVLQHNGCLRSFLVGRLAGYEEESRTELGVEAAGLALLPASSLLVLAETFDAPPGGPPAESLSAAAAGLSVWRRTDDGFVPADGSDHKPSSQPSLLQRWVRWFAQEQWCAVSLAASPDERSLGVVTSNGDVALYRLPALVPLHYLPHLDQALPKPSQIAWWTGVELMVRAKSGEVWVFGSDEELCAALADKPSEILLPCSEVVSTGHGLAYTLESRDCGPVLGPDEGPQPQEKEEDGSGVGTVVKMAGVFLWGWVRLASTFAVGAPVDEVERPSAESVTRRKVEWSLCEMRATTPEEIFVAKLNREEWGEALLLAEAYDIPSDRVRKRQWLKTPITVYTIKDYLSRVDDKDWALEQSLSCLPSDLDSQHALIQLGLGLTAATLEAVEAGARLSAGEREKALARARLLHQERVLGDVEALLPSSTDYDAAFFGRLRQRSLLDVALLFVEEERVEWAAWVVGRHRRALGAHWLGVLSSTAEVTPVEALGPLLPPSPNGAPRLLAAAQAPAAQAPAAQGPDELLARWPQDLADELERLETGSQLYERHPELLRWRGEAVGGDELLHWWEWRAGEVERRSGVPDMVLAFVDAGLDRGFADLQALRDDLAVWARLVYLTNDPALSFPAFQQAPPLRLLTSLLNAASSQEALNVLRDQAMPYLRHSQLFGRCEAKTILRQLILDQSRRSLALATQLFCEFRDVEDSVLGQVGFSATEMFLLAEEATLGSDAKGDDLIIPASKMLAALPDGGGLDPRAAEAERRLGRLVSLVSSLEQYGVSVEVAEAAAAVESCPKPLLRRLIQQCALKGGVEDLPWSLSDWERLRGDLEGLRRQVWPDGLAGEEVLEMLVEGLLSSGDGTRIGYAAAFAAFDPTEEVGERLAYVRAVGLAVAKAREYIHGASEASDPLIELAKSTLGLIAEPRPPDVRRELDLLAALELLESLGVKELPVRIWISEDKWEWVEKAVEGGLWKQTKTLLKLAHLLRAPSPVEERRTAAVLRLSAHKALEASQLGLAEKLCRRLVEANASQAWEECLAMAHVCKDPALGLDLVHFVIMHVPADRLEAVLDLSRRLKHKLLSKSLEKEEEPVASFENVGKNVGDVTRRLTHKVLAKEEEEKPAASFEDLGKLVKEEELRWRTGATEMWDCPEDAFASQKGEVMDEAEDEELFRLGTLLRLLKLDGAWEEADEAEWADAVRSTTALLGAAWARRNACLGLGLLLGLSPTPTAVLGRFHPDSVLLTAQAYLAAVKLLQPLLPLDRLLCLSPLALLKLVAKYLPDLPHSECRELFAETVKRLNRLGKLEGIRAAAPDVNGARFLAEAEYRKDTILGIAMTADEAAYQSALRLGEDYDVPHWDIKAAHLEFLLTSQPVAAAQGLIKSHALISALAADRGRFATLLRSEVLPLLNGREHSRVALFLVVLERGCGDLSAQRHRAFLKAVDKFAPKLDYAPLLGEEEVDIGALFGPHLTLENIGPLAKHIGPLAEERGLRTAQLYAALVLSEAEKGSRGGVSLDSLEGLFDGLDSQALLDLLPKILERLPLEEAAELLRRLYAYARQHEFTFEAALGPLSEALDSLQAQVEAKVREKLAAMKEERAQAAAAASCSQRKEEGLDEDADGRLSSSSSIVFEGEHRLDAQDADSDDEDHDEEEERGTEVPKVATTGWSDEGSQAEEAGDLTVSAEGAAKAGGAREEEEQSQPEEPEEAESNEEVVEEEAAKVGLGESLHPALAFHSTFALIRRRQAQSPDQ